MEDTERRPPNILPDVTDIEKSSKHLNLTFNFVFILYMVKIHRNVSF